MFEQFKTELLASLYNEDAETLARISKSLDMMGSRYDVVQKETALALPSEDGLPRAAIDYLVTRKIEGLSIGTLNLYKLHLQKFFEFCNKPLDSIRANDIRIFLYSYQESRHISNRSLDSVRISLSAFFSWAAANDYIHADPTRTIKRIQYEKSQRHALTQMELEIIRHACKTTREKALVEFLYSTGCRVSEVVTAKLSDIDWQANELIVLGKGSKHRKVYLNAKAVVSLKEYILSRNDDTDAIFVTSRLPHNTMSKEAIEHEVANIASRCPEITKTVTPHIFRHTTATTAIQSMPVQDVQRILGHESIATTMIYAEINQDSVKAEHKKYVV